MLSVHSEQYESCLVPSLIYLDVQLHKAGLNKQVLNITMMEHHYITVYLNCDKGGPALVAACKNESALYKYCHGNSIYVLQLCFAS